MSCLTSSPTLKMAACQGQPGGEGGESWEGGEGGREGRRVLHMVKNGIVHAASHIRKST